MASYIKGHKAYTTAMQLEFHKEAFFLPHSLTYTPLTFLLLRIPTPLKHTTHNLCKEHQHTNSKSTHSTIPTSIHAWTKSNNLTLNKAISKLFIPDLHNI